MTKIREASTAGVKSAGKGIFRARLINEGQGSSGYYTKELLKTYGPTTFSENRPCFANHSSEADWENGRDLTKIMGRLVSDAEYEEDADGNGALYANVKVRPEWVDFVDEYKDVIGMSISVSGEASEREINGEKRLVVESFDDTDPYRSVDFVVAAGRGGKVERMLESAKQIEERTANSKREKLQSAYQDASGSDHYMWVEDFDDSVVYINTDEGVFAIEYTSDEHGKIVFGSKTEVRRETNYVPLSTQENLSKTTEKDSDMDLETLAKQTDEKFAAVMEAIESLRPSETEPTEIDRADVTESALEAGLSKSARARVLKAVEAGEKPEDAIASEKALKEEYESEFKERHQDKGSDAGSGGRIVESNDIRSLDNLKF